MRKIIAILLLIGCLVCVCSCNNENDSENMVVQRVSNYASIYIYEIESISHPELWNSEYKYYLSYTPLGSFEMVAPHLYVNGEHFSIKLKETPAYAYIPTVKNSGNDKIVTGYLSTIVSPRPWINQETVDSYTLNITQMAADKVVIQYWNGTYSDAFTKEYPYIWFETSYFEYTDDDILFLEYVDQNTYRCGTVTENGYEYFPEPVEDGLIHVGEPKFSVSVDGLLNSNLIHIVEKHGSDIYLILYD